MLVSLIGDPLGRLSLLNAISREKIGRDFSSTHLNKKGRKTNLISFETLSMDIDREICRRKWVGRANFLAESPA